MRPRNERALWRGRKTGRFVYPVQPLSHEEARNVSTQTPFHEGVVIVASEDLMERLIEAERRAAAAEALLARYQERERLDNEARAKRRQDAAERKRKSRAGHTQSQNVTVTTCDDAGHCVTPPSPLPPQVSSSSPTPLITTSFPPISPPPGLAVADAPSPAPIS